MDDIGCRINSIGTLPTLGSMALVESKERREDLADDSKDLKEKIFDAIPYQHTSQFPQAIKYILKGLKDRFLTQTHGRECTRKCTPMLKTKETMYILPIEIPTRGFKHNIQSGGYNKRLDAKTLILQSLNSLFVVGKTTPNGCAVCTAQKKQHGIRKTSTVESPPQFIGIVFEPPAVDGVVFEQFSFMNAEYIPLFNTIKGIDDRQMSCYVSMPGFSKMFRYNPHTGVLFEDDTLPHAWRKHHAHDFSKARPHCVLPHNEVSYVLFSRQ